MLGALTAILFASYLGLSNGFQCYPTHPQAQFCNSDYVLRVKVNSGLQFEPPPLPGNPNKGRGQGERGRNRPNKFGPPGPDPLISQMAPAPLFGGGLGGGPPRFGPSILSFQKVTIKRLLMGKSKVLKSNGIGKFVKDRWVRYNGTVYMAPGVKLLPDRAYLIAGKIIENKLWLSGCNLHLQWDQLSLEQRGGLKKYYLKGCREKCSVAVCFGKEHCEAMSANPNTCAWRFDGNPNDNCYVKKSACKRHKDRCVWKDEDKAVKCKKDKQNKKKNKNKVNNKNKNKNKVNNNRNKLPFP